MRCCSLTVHSAWLHRLVFFCVLTSPIIRSSLIMTPDNGADRHAHVLEQQHDGARALLLEARIVMATANGAQEHHGDDKSGIATKRKSGKARKCDCVVDDHFCTFATSYSINLRYQFAGLLT